MAEVSIAKELPYDTSEAGVEVQQRLAATPLFDRNVLVVTYRRGLESFTVTTRTNVALPITRTSPWAYDAQIAIATRDAVLTSGAFAGATAHLSVLDDQVHAWGTGAEAVFTVGGDILPDEAIKLLESMRPA